ncbi:MAG: hypothetical protein Q9172_005467 [Xanthocarpia lactea]
MPHLASILLYPLLLFITAPLLLFAFITTIAASVTLLFRVSLVYADLAAVLIKTQLLHHQTSLPASPPPPSKRHRASSPPSQRRSSSSSESQIFGGGSRTPKSIESSGLAIYSAGSMQRDFEGVGGWRIPDTKDEDALWTSMNARLELSGFTEGSLRHHRRASGASATTTIRAAGMLDQQQQQQQGRVSPTTRSSADVGYREEYFGISRHASKSSTPLGTTGSSGRSSH